MTAETELQDLRAFRREIEEAWNYALGTSKPRSSYIIGNKLRRMVREARERHPMRADP